MTTHGPRERTALTPDEIQKAYRLRKKEGLPLSILKERFGCSIIYLQRKFKELEANNARI